MTTVVLLTSALLGSGQALAGINNATGTNVQQGSNRANTNQGGSDKSGSAVGGQVTGVVSSGRTSVDARNTSSDSSVSSGDVNGTNDSRSFVGQNTTIPSGLTVPIGVDITNANSTDNLQEGDNALVSSQTANLTTGDGVAGQVIGAVTTAGGSTSIVAANSSDNVDVSTGDATAVNDSAVFVGQDVGACLVEVPIGGGSATCTTGPPALAADITGGRGINVQQGDNRATSRQTANAVSGDGVAGQVIGAVSGGATSIDANNVSSNDSVDTGAAQVSNDHAAFVGQNTSVCRATAHTGTTATCTAGPVITTDISGVHLADNLQQGDNRSISDQSASATSGAGVAGEVIGAVTSAGGSTSIVAANTSSDSDVTTGQATAGNATAPFVGQNVSSCLAAALGRTVPAACTAGPLIAADISNVGRAVNVQEGDNRATGNQSARAVTGDGVAGQVVGAVSAGATSIDARNTSTNMSVATGESSATNDFAPYVGQNVSVCASSAPAAASSATCTAGPALTADIRNVGAALNLQQGSNRATASQAANGTSGDGVGGQVIGAVTSAGGSASVVAANTSTNSDVSTGDAKAANDLAAFVGLNFSLCQATFAGQGATGTCSAGPALSTADIADVTGANVQQGSNRLLANEATTASTGAGVGGQVLGVVSAGAASLDATNRTEDSSVQTGNSEASNALQAFVGLNFTTQTVVKGGAADISNVSSVQGLPNNIQEGNNTKTLTQSANASSGDAVAGQVSGVVTSAGGSASVVVDNSSTGIDATSGESRFDNTEDTFVGLNLSNVAFSLV